MIFSLLCLFFSPPAPAGVLLQGFYWDAPSSPGNSWWNRLAKEAPALGKAGFTAIWLPPTLKGAAGGYSMGYDPFDDYDIGGKHQRGTQATRWGTREELQRAAAILRANGLDLYLDTIVTHRQGDAGDRRFLYTNAYGQGASGRFQKGPADFGADGPFGRSLRQDSPYVLGGLKEAGDWLVKALDASGLRVDFAKGIDPRWLREYLSHGRLAQQLAIVELWGSLGEIQHFIRETGGRVAAFDFPLWEVLREMSNGNGFFDMRRLQGAGLLAQDPGRAVTFIENHDTDRDHKSFDKILAYAFLLTSEGYPTVFWRDYFEYGLKQRLDTLIWIHEALAAGGTVSRWADEDLYVYERVGGARLLVALNDNRSSERQEWVQTGFGPGVRLQDYTGQQPDVWTNEQGWAPIRVGPNGYVAYSLAGRREPLPRGGRRTTQEFAGAPDLDLKPAENGDFRTVSRVWAAAGSPMEFTLYFTAQGWPEAAQMEARVVSPKGSIVAEASGGRGLPLRGRGQAEEAGAYELQLRTVGAPGPANYWWKHDYQAPERLVF